MTPPRGRSDLTGRRGSGPRLPDTIPPDSVPTGLTRQQARVIVAYARHDTRKQAADELGISVFTVREHLKLAYARLGVSSFVGALRVLGWFHVPDDEQIVAMCDADVATNRLRVAMGQAQALLDSLDEHRS